MMIGLGLLVVSFQNCGRLNNTGASISSTSNSSASTVLGPPGKQLDSSWAPKWSNIVGYWPLNSSFSGTVGSALSTSGTGAAISNSLFKLGSGSASFNGTAYATTSASGAYAFPNTTFTIAGWVNSDLWNGGVIASDGGVGGGWALFGNPGGLLQVWVKNCGNVQFGTTSTASMNGGWHHFAVVIMTSTTVVTGTVITVYIDGIQGQTPTTYPSTGAYCAPSSQYGFGIGARSTPASPINLFTGNIDELAIWNVGLSASDIQSLYFNQAY